MALSIARPKHRSLTNPSLLRLFSTSSSSSSSSSSNDEDNPNNTDTPQSESPSPSQSSFSSIFSDVKGSLRQRTQQTRNQTQNQYLNRPSKIASLQEIKKNLSDFRIRSEVPSPTNPNDASSHSGRERPISFLELYKRNANAKSEVGAGVTGTRFPNPPGKNDFDAIRQSLRGMKSNKEANIERRGRDPISLDSLRNNIRFNPGDSPTSIPRSTVIGGTGELPSTVFAKEMKKGKEEKGTETKKTEFVKMYGHDELGEKLRILRPKDGVKGFSLHELSERVVKLREMEEKEDASQGSGGYFKDLRESIHTLIMENDGKAKRNSSE